MKRGYAISRIVLFGGGGIPAEVCQTIPPSDLCVGGELFDYDSEAGEEEFIGVVVVEIRACPDIDGPVVEVFLSLEIECVTVRVEGVIVKKIHDQQCVFVEIDSIECFADANRIGRKFITAVNYVRVSIDELEEIVFQIIIDGFHVDFYSCRNVGF